MVKPTGSYTLCSYHHFLECFPFTYYMHNKSLYYSQGSGQCFMCSYSGQINREISTQESERMEEKREKGTTSAPAVINYILATLIS